MNIFLFSQSLPKADFFMKLEFYKQKAQGFEVHGFTFSKFEF